MFDLPAWLIILELWGVGTMLVIALAMWLEIR
jgi:hypothetical protein